MGVTKNRTWLRDFHFYCYLLVTGFSVMLGLFYFLSFPDAFKITCNGNCVVREKAWGYRVQGFLKPLVCDPELIHLVIHSLTNLITLGFWMRKQGNTSKVYMACQINRYWKQLIIWMHMVWLYSPCYDLQPSHEMGIIVDPEGLWEQRSATSPQTHLGVHPRLLGSLQTNIWETKAIRIPSLSFPEIPTEFMLFPRGAASGPWIRMGQFPTPG